MKAPLCVFTMARNEAVFLPLWLRYYARTGADLVVLDHGSDDGSTNVDRGPRRFARVPVANPTTDDAGWMLRAVEETQRELLGRYEVVVYAEADEFLVPDPNYYSSLADFISRRRAHLPLTATGFEICDVGGASPIEFARDPIEGRGWRRNDRYDKTLICSAPTSWEVGFHRPRGNPAITPDPGLFLLHLHYADREYGWKRLCERMRRAEPSPGDLGYQNKYRNRNDYDRNFDQETGGASPVPDWLLGVL